MSQVLPPTAPNLPKPPGAYEPQYHSQHDNVLRLYFNQISNGFQQLLQGFNHFASLYDTTIQTAALANTAYPVTFNTTADSFGISLSTTSRIRVTRSGAYRVNASVEADNTGAGANRLSLWLRLNGVDVAGTASKTIITGTADEALATIDAILTLRAGDYFELIWAADSNTVRLLQEAAAAPVPAVPSARLTVNYLFPNNTT